MTDLPGCLVFFKTRMISAYNNYLIILIQREIQSTAKHVCMYTHKWICKKKPKEQLYATALVSIEIYTVRLILTLTELLPSSP